MSLEEAEKLLARSEAMRDEARKLHDEAKRLAQSHYGLVSGVTVLRSEGTVGVFSEVLNYFSGQMLWVKVRVFLPEEDRGRGRNFYHPWELVEPDEAQRLREEDERAYEKALAERLGQNSL